MVKKDLTVTDRDSLDLDYILVRIKLDIVAQTDGWHNTAKLKRDLPPYHNNAVKQVSALVYIGKRDNAVTELKLDKIHMQKRCDILGSAYLLGACFLDARLRLDLLHLGLFPDYRSGCKERKPVRTEDKKRQRRKYAKKYHAAPNHI